jgi:hypothetical protein
MSKTVGALVACLAGLSILGSDLAWGQTTAGHQRDSFWLGAGLGAGSEDFAGSFNASYQFGASLISLRAAGTAGLYDDGFSDYAVLYGRATRPSAGRYQVSAAVGLGLVSGCEIDGWLAGCSDVSTVVGLPLEVQAFWRPGSLIGLGLYGFANLNDARSFAGLTLGLQLGRLR